MTVKRQIGVEADYLSDPSATAWTGNVDDSVKGLWDLMGGRLTGVTGTNSITANVQVSDNFSYTDGLEIQFKAENSNSGAVEIDVGGAGFKAIKDNSGQALTSGVIGKNNLVIAKFYLPEDHFRLVASGGVQNVTVQGGLTVKRATAARTIATVASTTSLSTILTKSFQTAYSASRVVLNGGILLKTASGSDSPSGLIIALYVDGDEEQTIETMSWSGQAYFVPFDFEYLPADTSSHTYTIRVSSTNAATYPINGSVLICEEWGVNP